LSVQRQAVEHLFEIDFGAKNIRSFPLPVARIRKIFSARSGDFHRKIFGAGEKVAQLNRTSSRRSHDEPSQERAMPRDTHFPAAVGNSFVRPEFASPVREGMNQIRASRFWREASRPTVQKSKMRTVSISSGS
jgi:hypothetical protein